MILPTKQYSLEAIQKTSGWQRNFGFSWSKAFDVLNLFSSFQKIKDRPSVCSSSEDLLGGSSLFRG